MEEKEGIYIYIRVYQDEDDLHDEVKNADKWIKMMIR
jgi:hypothetical protein